MLQAIKVKNYRSFVDEARLNIRPITILLGRNSAGKSSITRLFPLIKKSIARQTSAPILWAASEFLDFGGIADVVNHKSPNGDLSISFELGKVSLRGANSSPLFTYPAVPMEIDYDDHVAFTAHLGNDGSGRTLYRGISIRINDDELRIRFKSDQVSEIELNGRRVERDLDIAQPWLADQTLFPAIHFGAKESFSLVPTLKPEIERLSPYLLPQMHGALSEINRNNSGVVSALRKTPPPESAVIPFISKKNVKWLLIYYQIELSAEEIDRLADLIFITHLGTLTSAIGKMLIPSLEHLAYIGPIRASGQRFYREQELSVEEIDEEGRNLAAYVKSLSSRDLQGLNEILEDLFDVRIQAKSTVGHISLEIAPTKGKQFDNLADVGFGFSQLLPLVAQVHASVDSNRNGRRYWQQIIAIEQPELHLHPAYQAKLADLFVTAVKMGSKVNLLLDTHSEAFMGRLAELVALGALKPDQVAVHFFEKDERSGSSSVRSGHFSAQGQIEDWPLGFFSSRT